MSILDLIKSNQNAYLLAKGETIIIKTITSFAIDGNLADIQWTKTNGVECELHVLTKDVEIFM